DPPHIKINPLASWTSADLAAYIAEHRLPPHPLVAEGFASIGCAPCTSALRPGEEARAGRWRGVAKTECGIHQQMPTGKQGRDASPRDRGRLAASDPPRGGDGHSDQ